MADKASLLTPARRDLPRLLVLAGDHEVHAEQPYDVLVGDGVTVTFLIARPPWHRRSITLKAALGGMRVRGAREARVRERLEPWECVMVVANATDGRWWRLDDAIGEWPDFVPGGADG